MPNLPSITAVWNRIVANSGTTFHMKKGAPFTYAVRNGHVHPDRTNQRIAKSHFEKALLRVPLANPCDVHNPSYIYAILMDDSIRAGEW